ncbi:MAG TPA: hypothetical protein VMP68_03840 [Candidatus Eisenbacteria bacterium]|nr:hypothetical protein [Candidatus Eisenbacteria bacterium]
MNIRDERTVGEQIKSGFRLAGWILLTLALLFLLLGSTSLVLDRSAHHSLVLRATGACGLVAISVLLFVSIHYWAKWFVGFLGLYAFKSAFVMALHPKSLYLQFLLLLTPAFVLCARCVLNNIPKNIEKLGFVLLAVTIGFTLVLDSTIPMLLGVLTFAAIELASYALRPKDQVQSTTHG